MKNTSSNLWSPDNSFDSSDVNTTKKMVNDGHLGTDGTLSQVQKIDKAEKSLYVELEKIVGDINSLQQNIDTAKTKKLPDADIKILQQNMARLNKVQSQLIEQIKRLADDRMLLYKSLGDKYVDLQTVVAESRNDLVNQKTVAGVMDKELSNIEAEMADLEEEKQRRMKLVEIDTYYSKRYQAYAGLMKLVAYICIPMLVIVILFKLEFISDEVRSLLLVLTAIIGGYFLFITGIDIWYRDNMNWDEYSFPFNQNNANNETVWEYDKRQLNKLRKSLGLSDMTGAVTKALGIKCYDENCCKHPDGLVKWDKKKGKCVPTKKLLKQMGVDDDTIAAHTGDTHTTTLGATPGAHTTTLGATPGASTKLNQNVKSGFTTLLDAAPVPSTKRRSLATAVEENSSVMSIDNLSIPTCQDNTSPYEGFSGF